MKRKRLLSQLLIALLMLQLALPAVFAEDGADGQGAQAAQTDPTAPFWVPTNTEKVLRDAPLPDHPRQTMVLEAAKNEYESGQVIVKALEAPLTGVTVTVSDLTYGNGEAVIDSANIELFKQHYIEVTQQTTGAYPKGWYPDALIPLTSGESFDIPLGQNQGIWLTVYVPKGQMPGDYEGALTVSANEIEFTVPIRLHVWDFELTDESHTQTAFAIWYDQVAHYHGVTKGTPEYWELMENYYWFQTEFRLPPDDLPIPSDDVDQFIAEAERFLTNPKVNSFRIPYYDGNTAKTEELVQKLRAKGWLDKGYFYIGKIDEPNPSMYPLVRQISEELHQIAPEVKHLVTKEPVEELIGYVNTWTPVLHLYDPAVAQYRQSLGEHVWWYTCIVPQHPYPSYHLDDDLVGTRLLSWMQRENKVEGTLYWSTTIFRKYDGTKYIDRDPWTDPMAFPGANGDGYLLYPGKELGINGPIGTIRLHTIREGMEDYEYLWLFEERMNAAAAALGLAEFDVDAAMKPYYNRLYQSINNFSENPELVLQVRREIAEQIVSLEQNPVTLLTMQPLADLQSEVTVYAEAGAQVAIDGQPLVPVEQHAGYDVYRQTFDLEIGLNTFELTVAKDGASKRQTVVLVGKAPAPPEFKVTLNKADTADDVNRWLTNDVTLTLADQFVTQGNHSMKAEYGTSAEFPNIRLFDEGVGFRSADWSKYHTLNFDAYNPNDHSVLFYVKFFDTKGGRNDTTPVTVTPRSWKNVSVPLQLLGNIDLTAMQGIELWMWQQSSPTTVYFDNFHFMAGEKLPAQDLSFQIAYHAAPGTITIDGDLSEDAWLLDQTYPYTIVGQTDNSGSFSLLWNDEYLYAGFDIIDNDVRDPSRDAQPWEDDSVELFIDGDFVKGPRNEHAPQYTVRFNDNQVFLNGAPSPVTAPILQKTKRTPTGYTLEMAIPWEVIGVQPHADQVIGITSHVNDDDVIDGVRSYGVLGYTEQGLGDVTTTENYKEFFLKAEQPPALEGSFAVTDVAFTDLSGQTVLTKLKHADSVLATATVHNHYEKRKTVTFAVALYDHKDRIKQIALVTKTLEPGSFETISAGFELPNQSNNNKVKVHLWDGYATKQPLVPDIVFQ